MFRFYCDNFGDTNRKWKFSKATSFERVVESYYEDEIYVWDADNCGDNVYRFAVTDGTTTKYFMLTHEWDISRDPVFNVNNYNTIKEITKAEANLPGDRDWISTRQTSYPERKKWPPMELTEW